MFVEILAIIAVPMIGLTGFLLGRESATERENKAYRIGLKDGYEEAKEDQNKIVRMAK